MDNKTTEQVVKKYKAYISNLTFNIKQMDAGSRKEKCQAELDMCKEIVSDLESIPAPYTGKGLRQIIEKRIKELNEADKAFCYDRWDNPKADNFKKAIARENSNSVTCARQELEGVLREFDESVKVDTVEGKEKTAENTIILAEQKSGKVDTGSEGVEESCEHEEIMKQGDGYVYGSCKKCGKELY